MLGLFLRKMRIFVMAFAVFGFITGMPCFVCSAEPVPAEPSGSGTAIDPYQISTLAELYWISENPSMWVNIIFRLLILMLLTPKIGTADKGGRLLVITEPSLVVFMTAADIQ
jgi:hypothetical protein